LYQYKTKKWKLKNEKKHEIEKKEMFELTIPVVIY